jgi:hypothetical protein
MIKPCPPWRKMRPVKCPPGFQVVPHDSRFYAVYEGDSMLCVCAYKTGAMAVVKRLTGTEGK